MFEFVQNNRQVVGIALGLVILGLMVGTGMGGLDLNGGDYLAKVGGVRITNRDLAMANGGQAVADAAKPQLLQQAVQQQLLINEANTHYVSLSDAQLREQIMKIDAFKGDNGQFSPDRYKAFLVERQMSVVQLEARIADELRTQRLAGSLAQSSIGSKATGERLLLALAETRDVASYEFTPDRYLAQVSVNEADIKQYYDKHQLEFRVPERVKLSYLVLSRDEMAQTIPVDASKVQAYYDAHKTQLAPEERQVRHILIKADPKASPEVKAAAKAKAEQLLVQLKANPARFAELAKQHSEDTGSAVQGGDLGFFGRGAMVKAFDEVAFKLAKGELSGVVESEFGYHILQVEDTRTKTMEQVRPNIEQRLRQEAVQKRFAADAEKFSDMVYQQGESLQPVAAAFKLTVRDSDWLTREASADSLLNNAKVREAAFSDDVLKKKHNTEAIEIVPGTLLSARVVAHEEAKLQPMAEVAGKITELLKRERAGKLAQAEGKKALAALQAGKAASFEWPASKPVSRLRPEGFDKPSVDAIFGLSAAKLPGYAGVENKDGYSLLRVVKSAAQPLDPGMKQGIAGTLEKLSSQETLAAYLMQLRKQQAVEMPVSR